MNKTIATITLIALGTAALAHGGVKNKDVLARMEVMKTIGEQMKVLGAMAKGQTAFDAAAANAALTEIAAQSAQIAPMFETRADDPKSEALPIIWAQWDDFATLASASETTAAALAGTITAKADLGRALGQLGGTCKACHSKYRE
ncbi:c-type cytochrome [Tropicibacter naphthalenivorans]|uniref:Cytochrome c556 n=1 Tax=Tropicibacter naphthalenivorans TaxID=441103 RepID=A0A0P1GGB9_9RHOB|nr:cytochrome c [Tropicibacter naphthalenivorans]CUH80629.1 Cytochrome c556 [Tropicibacter naphthalenivorans]SMC89105.1 Cytochrome c556 [Tropicibacter naphthalenivorans]